MSDPPWFPPDSPPWCQWISFEGSEAFTRDHRGRRLLADLDGCGELNILESPEDLQIESDGTTGEGFSFTQDLVATSALPGPFRALALSGTQPTTPPSNTAPEASGPGWLLWSGEKAVLDEGAQVLEPVHLKNPLMLPVSCGFVAEVPIPWLPAPYRLADLDRFIPALEPSRSPRGFRVQNMSAAQTLASHDSTGRLCEGVEASHLNTASWTLPLLEGTRAVLMTKTHDRFHGRQRARVLVDGAVVGWWHLPRQDRRARWGIAHFWIPAPFVAGKEHVEVSIDPPAGVPLWSVGEVRQRALIRR